MTVNDALHDLLLFLAVAVILTAAAWAGSSVAVG